MTTFVYEDWDGHDKVLWSSFRFDMRFGRLMARQNDGRHYLWVPGTSKGLSLAVMSITMLPGTAARHEIAQRRKPDPPFEPSARKGLDTFVYKDSETFVIIQLGHGVPTKPDRFASLFERYRIEFCAPVG